MQHIIFSLDVCCHKISSRTSRDLSSFLASSVCLHCLNYRQSLPGFEFLITVTGHKHLQSRYRAPFKILHLTLTGRYLALSFWLVVTWQSKSLPGSIFFISIGRYLASFSFYACRYLTKHLFREYYLALFLSVVT